MQIRRTQDEVPRVPPGGPPGHAGPARGWRPGPLSAGGLRAGGAGVLVTVLVACGSPAPAEVEWSADGASFGVDRTAWPEAMDAARDVLAALPEELGGEARELLSPGADEAASGFAGVTYGERITVLVADDTLTRGPSAAPEAAGAQSTLAAMFGVAWICDPDTYAGTIERHDDVALPGYTPVDAGTPAWFSCRIADAEGAGEDFTAHAVGWTSPTTAWLTIGPDEAAVRQVVTALHQATG